MHLFICGCFSSYLFIYFFLDWSTLVVGKISSWINPDSPVQATRRNSELVSN